ncbi:hypothetical protein EW146_g5937 [Bondarzewia mesenterica]|uniref:C2H2-type domain-containing protein n=1 Tax=Bondarzewia mesenterica TaxID=1095465 RepID=A0A4S4LPZ6_9AGAM|nr:hypothetical protein EW146_g5937 [Bondarzewia mesenterica]
MENNGGHPQYPSNPGYANEANAMQLMSLADIESRGITPEQYQTISAQLAGMQRVADMGLQVNVRRHLQTVAEDGRRAQQQLQQLDQWMGNPGFAQSQFPANQFPYGQSNDVPHTPAHHQAGHQAASIVEVPSPQNASSIPLFSQSATQPAPSAASSQQQHRSFIWRTSQPAQFSPQSNQPAGTAMPQTNPIMGWQAAGVSYSIVMKNQQQQQDQNGLGLFEQQPLLSASTAGAGAPNQQSHDTPQGPSAAAAYPADSQTSEYHPGAYETLKKFALSHGLENAAQGLLSFLFFFFLSKLSQSSRPAENFVRIFIQYAKEHGQEAAKKRVYDIIKYLKMPSAKPFAHPVDSASNGPVSTEAGQSTQRPSDRRPPARQTAATPKQHPVDQSTAYNLSTAAATALASAHQHPSMQGGPAVAGSSVTASSGAPARPASSAQPSRAAASAVGTTKRSFGGLPDVPSSVTNPNFVPSNTQAFTPSVSTVYQMLRASGRPSSTTSATTSALKSNVSTSLSAPHVPSSSFVDTNKRYIPGIANLYNSRAAKAQQATARAPERTAVTAQGSQQLPRAPPQLPISVQVQGETTQRPPSTSIPATRPVPTTPEPSPSGSLKPPPRTSPQQARRSTLARDLLLSLSFQDSSGAQFPDVSPGSVTESPISKKRKRSNSDVEGSIADGLRSDRPPPAVETPEHIITEEAATMSRIASAAPPNSDLDLIPSLSDARPPDDNILAARNQPAPETVSLKHVSPPPHVAMALPTEGSIEAVQQSRVDVIEIGDDTDLAPESAPEEEPAHVDASISILPDSLAESADNITIRSDESFLGRAFATLQTPVPAPADIPIITSPEAPAHDLPPTGLSPLPFVSMFHEDYEDGIEIVELPPESPLVEEIEPEPPAPSTPGVSEEMRDTREKTPLFLPSPSQSPVDQSPPPIPKIRRPDSFALKPGMLASKSSAAVGAAPFRDSFASARSNGILQPSRGQRSSKNTAYVLVPSPPEYVKRLKEREANRRRKESAEVSPELREKREREAVQYSSTRLRPNRCYWMGCDARLNSEMVLRQHVKTHIKEEEKLRRQTNDYLSPSAKLFKPDLSKSLPPLPHTLPSYMSVTLRVSAEPISRERHVKLGPWVFRRIFGDIDRDMLKSHDAKASRSSLRMVDKTATSEADDQDAYEYLDRVQNARMDEYDFLTRISYPTRISCDDIDSQSVSRRLFNGMVFWGPGDSDDGDGVSNVAEATIPDTPTKAISADLDSHVIQGVAGAPDAYEAEKEHVRTLTEGTPGSEGGVVDVVMSAPDGDVKLPKDETETRRGSTEGLDVNMDADAVEELFLPTISMATGFEISGPTYVSPRSADVILSDIRPIKLTAEALQCLNALLDEILRGVVAAAHSLSTDRLKLGLLKVLPTTLGKEALLEAEMELRAYWERTSAGRLGPSPATAEGGIDADFSLQWAIELMRLKCEAYSTLNDSDEDAQAESRLNDRLGGPASGKKAAMIAPAALYLTAILECICEHILSNIGRVATRDSSRTIASLQELFVALCEDDSMYSLFKSMKMYDQIESLVKAPRSRRSKSISRPSERLETPSPFQDGVSLKESASALSSRSRISSESSTSTAVLGPNNTSRSSQDKHRAIMMFKAPNRSSSDRDIPHTDLLGSPRKSQDGPRKSSGGQSDTLISGSSVDEEVGLISSFSASLLTLQVCAQGDLDQEFDDLMRSGDTMKMSLTPDRLRTMEVHKQGKSQRMPRHASAENIAPPKMDSSPTISPPSSESKLRSVGTRRPSLHAVESIVEDEEEPNQPNGITTVPSNIRAGLNDIPRSLSPSSLFRLRSLSTSNAPHGLSVVRKASLGLGSSVSTPPVSMRSKPDQRIASKQDGVPGVPKRTRKVQRNRESLDLDDIMNGFDDENEDKAAAVAETKSAANRKGGPGYVSPNTQELIDFLAEGPPVTVQPHRPAAMSSISLTPTTKSASRGSGRLQRMISKLSLGGDRSDSPSKVRRTPSANTISVPPTPSVPLNFAVPLPVPVKPIPPRILVAPLSPPSSPSRGSTPDTSTLEGELDRSRKQSLVRRAVPNWESFDSPPIATPPKDRLTPSPRPPPSPVPPPKPSPSSSVQSINGIVKPAVKREPVPALREESSRPRSARSEKNGENGLAKESSGTAHKPSSYRPRSSRSNRPTSAGSDAGSKRASVKKPVLTPEPVETAPLPPSLSEAMVLEMRRFLAKATTADECRLLVDMFMTKAGISFSLPTDGDALSPTRVSQPSDPDISLPLESMMPLLETSLVEMFLGGDYHESLLSGNVDDDGAVALVSPHTPKRVDVEHINIQSLLPASDPDTHGEIRTQSPTVSEVPSRQLVNAVL